MDRFTKLKYNPLYKNVSTNGINQMSMINEYNLHNYSGVSEIIKNIKNYDLFYFNDKSDSLNDLQTKKRY